MNTAWEIQLRIRTPICNFWSFGTPTWWADYRCPCSESPVLRVTVYPSTWKLSLISLSFIELTRAQDTETIWSAWHNFLENSYGYHSVCMISVRPECFFLFICLTGFFLKFGKDEEIKTTESFKLFKCKSTPYLSILHIKVEKMKKSRRHNIIPILF